MKLARAALRLRSPDDRIGMYPQFRQLRAMSLGPSSANAASVRNDHSNESTDDFERRIFGGSPNPTADSFYQKLDKLEKARGRPAFGSLGEGGGGGFNSPLLEGLDDSFDTSLSDGLDGRLKKAATYFEFDPEEIRNDESYAFRPDVTFRPGMTYETKDLDIKRPGVRKPFKRIEFETTTEEVLRKADFRNVRFLANFITEAGIIIKRSQTRISAKAQRKVAREIKTARAFGLMPFTTMGQDPFVYGKTREEVSDEDDYYYEDNNDYIVSDPVGAPDID